MFSDQPYWTENCLWRGSRNLMDLSQGSESNPLRAFGHHIKTVPVRNKNIYICSGNQNTSASSWDFFFFRKTPNLPFPGTAEKINHLWHLWYICNPRLVASRYRARRVRRVNKHCTKKKDKPQLCLPDTSPLWPTTRATCAFLLSSCLGWARLSPALVLVAGLGCSMGHRGRGSCLDTVKGQGEHPWINIYVNALNNVVVLAWRCFMRPRNATLTWKDGDTQILPNFMTDRESLLSAFAGVWIHENSNHGFANRNEAIWCQY